MSEHEGIVVADHLIRRYGSHLAVRDVSFSIAEGEVIGLLGPNGSGKSTILRMLSGFLPPSAGTARIDGYDVIEDNLAARMQVGYVPEDAPLYDGMRVGEFLYFMATIKGVPARAARAAVDMVYERLTLGPVAHMLIGRLSRGYRQRVAIGQALVSDPPVLILDEPTNALDAYQVIGVRELIRSLAGRRTVLVASHVLSEIERIASRIMILVDGKLLTTDATREAGSTRWLCLHVRGSLPEVLDVLRHVHGVVSVEPEGGASTATAAASFAGDRAYIVEAAPAGEVAAGLAAAVVAQGFALTELSEMKTDLERIFLDLTRRATAAPTEAA